MALTYDQITAITEKHFVPKLYDNIFNSTPLLKRMKDKGRYQKIDGGERVIIPLEYAQLSAAGWYTGAETLSTTDNETMTGAEFTWKQYYANISISRLDELKNAGDSQIVNFVKAKTKNAEKKLLSDLATGLYSDGTDPKSIVGLRDHVAVDQTVGGISQTDNSWWQAQVDSTTTTLTIAAMQTRYNAASLNNESPSVAVCTKAIYNTYYGLLQPQQRFVDTESAKGGFSSLMFNGLPILHDTFCPTGNLFFLNEDNLHLLVHSQEDMRFEPFQKPINQNVKVAKIYWMGVFGSSNNRLHARLSALTA